MNGIVPNGDAKGDEKYIVWFDIDNTLYPNSTGIAGAMGKLIQKFFEENIHLPPGDHRSLKDLHTQYLNQYGLALRGLVADFGIDPIQFDEQCDQALDLESMLKLEPKVCKLLKDIKDSGKAEIWAITNAYQIHARRVLKILDVEQYFTGVVFCDYRLEHFACKPEQAFFKHAMAQAGVSDGSRCLFVDDNLGNVQAAKIAKTDGGVGWRSCIYYREADSPGGVAPIKDSKKDIDDYVDDLDILRQKWKEFGIFKQ